MTVIASTFDRIFGAIDAIINNERVFSLFIEALSKSSIIGKTETTRTEDNFSIKQKVYVLTDGHSYTLERWTSSDGNEKHYREKRAKITKEQLKEMEAKAVADRNYDLAAQIKDIVDSMK